LTGEIRPDRFERGVMVVVALVERAQALGALRIEAVATEALRSARNGQEFLDRVRARSGLDVRIITGAEEAELTARGVLAQIETGGRVVIADIGGGSTELIETWDGRVYQSTSLPVGSGTMTDVHVSHDPPSEVELAAIMRVSGEKAEAFFNRRLGQGGGKLVLVGGVGEYLLKVCGCANPMPASALEVARLRAVSLTAAELATVAGAPVARARVLPAGFAIAQQIADLTAPDQIESVPNGLRMGLLLGIANRCTVND
jgi:exopolyphosphatase/guanosine-5'-triphosphate,3'-diphosphate pyrophosphatase